MTDTGLQIGRKIKARRIAAAIRSLDGTAADAAKMTDAEWTMADALSRAKECPRCHGSRTYFGQWCTTCAASGKVAPQPDHAPSPETRALVLEYLSQPEAPAVDHGEPRDEDIR